MKSVDEARATMLAALTARPRSERVALDQAHRRVLAADIVAPRDHPPFDGSAMDGYALRAADAPGKLKIVGEAAAGRALERALAPGEAARIFTGAPLPAGADAVLMQEDATRAGDWVSTSEALKPGQFVRPTGMDFKAGALLLRAGATLDGIALAAAAAAGEAQVDVAARPRIALMANGDEIVPPGATLAPDQIFESVSFGMSGLVREWGGQPTRLAAVEDDVDALAAAFAAALEQHELLVTLGGASVGDHDLVKPALAKLGAQLAVDTVSLRPGKPTFFAVTAHGPVLGLPGNPASALVCAHLFLRPLLDRLLGRAQDARMFTARLAAPLPANGPREQYVRGWLSEAGDGARLAHPAEQQDSSLLSVFRDATILIRQGPDTPALAPGARVDCLDLHREA